MNLNSTPSANRIHIAFFGRRNVGKSSLVNALTGQEISLVSDVLGTTTDPVYKSMELLPLGPVTIIDTAGIDDEGELGLLRIEKTMQVLNKTDIAILVLDSCKKIDDIEEKLLCEFKQRNIQYIIVQNKADLLDTVKSDNAQEIFVSAKENININELKELIGKLYQEKSSKYPLVKDIVSEKDIVILVTPIDSSAPKGRLILPQQQVIRELLDVKAMSVVVQQTELVSALNSLSKKPKLVITDSQVFEQVDKQTPKDIFLTSFSILFARHKGVLFDALNGVKQIEKLKDNDTVLISEGCTHHRQCEDIGTVKLPAWIKNYTNKNINFEFSSGTTFPKNLGKYSMIIHCGGCMLNEKEVLYRYAQAKKQNIPISNYGITISYLKGILDRSIEIFK